MEVLTHLAFIQLRNHAMTPEEIQNQPAPVTEAPAAEPAPALPDYVLDENAVLKDVIDTWRHGRAPDYSRTRKVYAESSSTTFTVPSYSRQTLTTIQQRRLLTPPAPFPTSSKSLSRTGKSKHHTRLRSRTGVPLTPLPTPSL